MYYRAPILTCPCCDGSDRRHEANLRHVREASDRKLYDRLEEGASPEEAERIRDELRSRERDRGYK